MELLERAEAPGSSTSVTVLDAVASTTRVARDLRSTLLAYVRLTKPRIVGLLVVTTIPAMILAEGGFPSFWLMLATVVGGSIVAGGANAMNMYFDRDIDELMLRTRGRPVPAGQVEPEKAAIFGLVAGATRVPSTAAHREHPRGVPDDRRVCLLRRSSTRSSSSARRRSTSSSAARQARCPRLSAGQPSPESFRWRRW